MIDRIGGRAKVKELQVPQEIELKLLMEQKKKSTYLL